MKKLLFIIIVLLFTSLLFSCSDLEIEMDNYKVDITMTAADGSLMTITRMVDKDSAY